jgi:hypothetical protein
MIGLINVLGNSEAIGEEEKFEVLDLHKDHDLDRPTQEAPSCVPVNKLFPVGDGTDRFGLSPAVKTDTEKMELDGKDSKLHNTREKRTMAGTGGWLSENTATAPKRLRRSLENSERNTSSWAEAPLPNKFLELHKRSAEVKKKPVDSAASTMHLTNSNSARGTDATVNTIPTMIVVLPQSSVRMLPASSPAISMVKSFYEIIYLS